MAAWTVELRSSAARELQDLPRDSHKRIKSAIDSLSDNPLPQGCRKLRGFQSLYRIRVSDYRVVYEVRGEERVILITRVRHRLDVYR